MSDPWLFNCHFCFIDVLWLLFCWLVGWYIDGLFTSWLSVFAKLDPGYPTIDLLISVYQLLAVDFKNWPLYWHCTHLLMHR